jgi:pimeloyl-ACP methyl ester carboxylesterase
MLQPVQPNRRRIVAAALSALATAQVPLAASASRRAPLVTAQMKPNIAFASMKQVDAGVLSIGYAEDGPANGPVAILLHGWPYDIHSYVDVAPLLAAAGYRVIVPYLRGYGTTRFLSPDTPRNGQQAAVAVDVINLMDSLGIQRAIVGGFDWGARTANILAALWPERVVGQVAVSGYLITNRKAQEQPLPPAAELGWWYQYYFSTERGRAGYDKNRHSFNKLIWKNASPGWDFDDETYDRSANAFGNPDHVAIVIHNYRWRLGLAPGEAKYDDLEKVLEGGPVIRVPTVTIASDFDGSGASGTQYAAKFSGPRSHRILKGIGHNVPQEAPRAFAQAMADVGSNTITTTPPPDFRYS